MLLGEGTTYMPVEGPIGMLHYDLSIRNVGGKQIVHSNWQLHEVPHEHRMWCSELCTLTQRVFVVWDIYGQQYKFSRWRFEYTMSASEPMRYEISGEEVYNGSAI